ncbi:EAL domain-containing protein [Lyngbya aestuarii]|uniref:EAL domain-containing protein n=1 Tax=Lyngbya aestuarii TaxID=118322 RepID=UPI00403D8F84
MKLMATAVRLSKLLTKRQQSWEQLRQERDIVKTLIETSSAFFAVVAADGKTLMMNQGFLDALGYTFNEVVESDYLSTFIGEADRKKFSSTFVQMRNQASEEEARSPILNQSWVLTKDGRKLLVEWRSQPVFKKNGGLNLFCYAGIDITQHRQLKEDLQHNKQRYCAIVEEQTEPICRFLSDGTLTFVNNAYCRYFNKTRDQLIGHSFFTLIPAEYRDKLPHHIANLSLKNPVATREYRLIMSNGDIRWQQWTDRIIFEESAHYPGSHSLQPTSLALTKTGEENSYLLEFQSVGRDITERRFAEQETARLASFPLLNPNPVVETDLEGNVKYLNPEAMQILPNLQETGFEHPFLAGVLSMAKILQQEGSLRREVKIGKVYYEQVLHYLPEIQCFRIYAFDITERKQAEEQLIYNAFYDQLTGLANRALFMDRLKQAVQRVKQSSRSHPQNPPYLLAVLFLDLNRFKLVNDSLGNQVGDQLLQHFASRLQRCLSSTDTLARLGGDEFAILLEGIQDLSAANRVADAIQTTLNLPFRFEESEVFMTLSIGIAFSTTSDHHQLGDDGFLQPEDLLRNASIAMYRAKAQGKSCYEVFDSTMHRRIVDRLQLETDLRRAVERQEFQVYYQPIVSLASGRIKGFEALLRWQHPHRGLVSPNEFIPTAEETGLITLIDWQTLREACSQMKAWQEEFRGSPPLTINVNLSCKQFTQPNVLEQIDQILKETRLAASSLKLEITESEVMENPDLVRALLLQLKERKINLCIDDFGTGYSSLSRLQHFPVNTLKIDRSFVSRIGSLGENLEIIQTIVKLARALSMDVVAEGIELSEQISPLIAMQCQYGQGYFFSRPVDKDAARLLLKTQLLPEGKI